MANTLRNIADAAKLPLAVVTLTGLAGGFAVQAHKVAATDPLPGPDFPSDGKAVAKPADLKLLFCQAGTAACNPHLELVAVSSDEIAALKR